MDKYSDLQWCKELVTEKTKLNPSDLEPLLQVSAGKSADGVTVYRPYYVVARLLASRAQQVTRADVIEFVNPLEIYNESLKLQRALDQSMELIIPEGMEATDEILRPAGTTVKAFSGSVRSVGIW